jgi:hypothetical protein
MRRVGLAVILILGVALAPLAAEVQQAGRLYRIGILWPASSTSLAPFLAALQERLGELGYVHRKNTLTEARWADGRIELLPVLATELVGLNVDLIMAPGEAAIYIDSLLRGANASDLPLEEPSVFDLVVNLRTARALGLTISPSVLLRADQVIE